MSRINSTRRSGFTLVELMAAPAITAILTTSSFMLVRTAHNDWTRHRDDSERRREAIATLQHLRVADNCWRDARALTELHIGHQHRQPSNRNAAPFPKTPCHRSISACSW